MPGLSGEVGETRVVDVCSSRFNSSQTLYCKGRWMNPMRAESGVTENETKEVERGDQGMQPGFGNGGLLGGSGVSLLKVWLIVITWELIRNAEFLLLIPNVPNQNLHV